MSEGNGDKAIRIWVPGIPQPGGSKQGFAVPVKGTDIPDPADPTRKLYRKYQAVVTEDNRKSKPWRESVAWAAKEKFSDPIEGPIEVSYKFFMPRPKSHFGKRGLRPSAPTQHTVKPDVTKLIRSTEDAMKGIAWIDDSNVVDQHGRKVYGHRPGALIIIKPADPEDEAAKAEDEQIVKQLGMRFLGMGA
jgi:Holliday junction resolvase RusA-like endonuclease